MKDFTKLETNELNLIMDVLEEINFIEDKTRIELQIADILETRNDKKESYNKKLTTEMLLEMKTITRAEYDMLKILNINNIDELKVFDFSKYKNEIPSYMFEDFQYVIDFLDFDRKKEETSKKK